MANPVQVARQAREHNISSLLCFDMETLPVILNHSWSEAGQMELTIGPMPHGFVQRFGSIRPAYTSKLDRICVSGFIRFRADSPKLHVAARAFARQIPAKINNRFNDHSRVSYEVSRK